MFTWSESSLNLKKKLLKRSYIEVSCNFNHRMRAIFIAVILSTFTACSLKEGSVSNEASITSATDSELAEELQSKKALIDSLFNQNRKQVRVIVKTASNDSLTEVYNEKWPEDIETIFNLLADSTGSIVRISEIPYSESGDWSIMYSHYFDTNGNTFANERRIKAFNNLCPGDDEFDQLTEEIITKFYSPKQALIDSTYKMMDEQNLDITSKKCQQEVEGENLVFNNIREYTFNKGIKTATNKN